jgi:hypothetical protein
MLKVSIQYCPSWRGSGTGKPTDPIHPLQIQSFKESPFLYLLCFPWELLLPIFRETETNRLCAAWTNMSVAYTCAGAIRQGISITKGAGSTPWAPMIVSIVKSYFADR